MIKKTFTQTQIIALGFFLMIAAGTLLLLCPFSSRNGSVPVLDALFTATSASCVTGLVTVDTYTQWSRFGQVVILILIQIGGLGFMTIATLFSFFLRRKISLRERGILQESMNSDRIGGIVRLVRLVLKGTLLCEGLGALLLSFRFVPLLGWGEGLFYSIFHAVSAFCNAGFDLMGRYAPYDSLVRFQTDPLVNGVLIALIVMGGIGFLVWQDVVAYRWHWKEYTMQTKLVLTVTAVLLLGGTLGIWLLERHRLFAGQAPAIQLLEALFASASVRTAGFNTVDLAGLSEGTKLFHLFFMLVGGSPGSTAGGIKTTTLAVLVLGVRSNVRHEADINVFGRRLEEDAVKRASAILMINLTLALVASLWICSADGMSAMDAMFEAFSAIGTVGITVGITRDLGLVSRLLIIFLMYCGRVGSLSFALSFSQRKRPAPVRQPVEKIAVG